MIDYIKTKYNNMLSHIEYLLEKNEKDILGYTFLILIILILSKP